MKYLVRILLVLAIGGALAGGLAWSLWPQPVQVEVAVVTRGRLRVSVDEDGRTRIRQRYVVAAPLAGNLLRIVLDPGDAVTRDTTALAVIEPSPPDILDVRAVAQAEAKVRAARAAWDQAVPLADRAREEMEFAEHDLARTRQLVKTNSATKRDLEQAEMLYRTSLHTYTAAKHAQDIAQFELELAQAALVRVRPADDGPMDDRRLSILAPITGQVLRLFQQSATVVKPGDRLLEVGDPTDLEIEVDVLSQDAVKIRLGDKAFLEHWGADRPLPATVRRIEPAGFTKISALGVEEQRVNVILDLDEPPENWRELGDAFRVETRIVIWEQDDVLQVSAGALFRHRDRWAVFAVRDARAELRTVEIGRRNSLAAQILSGLDPGDEVILYPGDKIHDGVRVQRRDLSAH